MFLDVVEASVGDDSLVAIGVVEFGVDDVLQRGDLWEALGEHVEQGEEAFWIVVGHHDDNHPLTGGSVADDEVAQKARVVANVIVFKPMGFCMIAYSEAYIVAWILLQGAMLNVEHFVEELWDVKAEGAGGELVSIAGSKLFLGSPCFGGKGEFQFVAIVVDTLRTADLSHAGAVDVAETLQVVAHLALFGFELGFVAESLPFASAAHPKVGTARIDAEVGALVELHGPAFSIVLFLLV